VKLWKCIKWYKKRRRRVEIRRKSGRMQSVHGGFWSGSSVPASSQFCSGSLPWTRTSGCLLYHQQRDSRRLNQEWFYSGSTAGYGGCAERKSETKQEFMYNVCSLQLKLIMGISFIKGLLWFVLVLVILQYQLVKVYLNWWVFSQITVWNSDDNFVV